MIDDILFQQVALGIAVFAAFYVFYYVFDGALLGPEHSYWNGFRAAVLPSLDGKARELGLFTVNRAVSAEYACTVKAPLEEIETFLHEAGYDRNVLAGLKYRGDRADEDYEVTSWAKRVSGSPLIPDALAFWQTHVWVFDNQDGTFDLYAHYEYSSMNPTIAYQHLRAIGMDRERGVKEIKQDLIGDPFTHYVL